MILKSSDIPHPGIICQSGRTAFIFKKASFGRGPPPLTIYRTELMSNLSKMDALRDSALMMGGTCINVISP